MCLVNIRMAKYIGRCTPTWVVEVSLMATNDISKVRHADKSVV